MSGLTFYGHFVGESSFPVVCRQLARWLSAQGLDLQQIELRSQFLERAQHQTALIFAWPEHITRFRRPRWLVGYHVCDVDQVPEHWVDHMNTEDLVLTPSEWCAEVFVRCGVEVPIQVVPHGIDPESFYLPAPANSVPPRSAFTFRHFTSSAGSRKGTAELAFAFALAFPNRDEPVQLIVHGGSGVIANDPRIVYLDEPPVTADRQRERYWGADVVVQPSRAEGFGLVPVESLASGTPVIATTATGHAMWAPQLADHGGFLPLTPGPSRRCPPGPGSAPSVRMGELVDALRQAYRDHAELRAATLTAAGQVAERFSWDSQLAASPLLDSIRSML